jgi:hypothetical protein
MSIHVSLGTNQSEERELTKTINWGDTLTTPIECDVYEPVDRLNPIIILD